MNDPKKKLKYLRSRLERLSGGELSAAESLVSAAISVDQIQPEAEHALFTELWEHISRALDHENFDLSNFDEVKSIESEVAGHVLTYRMARGWLVRAPGSPTKFPCFSEAIAQPHHEPKSPSPTPGSAGA